MDNWGQRRDASVACGRLQRGLIQGNFTAVSTQYVAVTELPPCSITSALLSTVYVVLCYFTCFMCGIIAAVVHKITVANTTVHGFNENKR